MTPKVALVTGAAGPIGRAIARELLGAGHAVALADRNPAVEEAARSLGGGAHAFTLDLGTEPAIRGLVAEIDARLGGVDILVNNAGIHPKKDGMKFRVEEITLAQWQDVLHVNLAVPFLLCQAVLPGMRAKGWGRIVNISSRGGRSVSPLVAGHYAASKAGLIGLTRVLAFEIGGTGITANCVAPGPIGRGMAETSRAAMEALQRSIPVGRAGEPEDVAAAVGYLASDRAGFVTGAILDVAGGAFMP